MKKLIVIGSISWLTGFIAVLITSFIHFETPGIADIIGFASFLFLGSLLLIAVCYFPFLLLTRRWASRQGYFLISPWVLALIFNAPLYFILWQTMGGYFSGEAYLITMGFFVTAFSFGAGYSWRSFTFLLQVIRVLSSLTEPYL